MPRSEILECSALPAGYSYTLHLWRVGSHYKFRIDVTAPNSFRALPAGYSLTPRLQRVGSHYKFRIDVTAPSSFRTVHSLEQHSTRAAALQDAEAATREHLERFTALYPAGVRNRITTWLNTLTAPIENEQQLF